MYAANADTEVILINWYIKGLSEAQAGRHVLSFPFALLGSEDRFIMPCWKNQEDTEGWNLISSLAELSFRHEYDRS